MNLDVATEEACERVPGLVRGVLLLLPEGFLLAGVGDKGILDLEPLMRSAARCFSSKSRPCVAGHADGLELTEYMFVIRDQMVVMQRGQRDPRLALAVMCTRESNLNYALSTSRLALREIESRIDLTSWGL